MTNDISQESWKPVIGFENVYEVSDQGRVRRTSNGRYLSTSRGCPYIQVYLVNGSKKRHVQVQILVLEAFVGERPYRHQACHCNGIPADNRLENLRWDTAQGNSLDKNKHGTMLRGEKNKHSVLCAGDIERIHDIWINNTIKIRARVDEWLGITPGTTTRVLRGHIWSHLRPKNSPVLEAALRGIYVRTKHVSAETRAKRSASLKGLKRSPEIRAKISLIAKQRKLSTETRLRISASLRKYYATNCAQDDQ